eukprot:TRINITY_DN27799_c0_g1_i1.p1 TRINITY_DN27799_c0_g1~~TRINITY_DN27799_c0_g1_i1.p1  ORF type:complete len:153 (-),score=48.52 TRINITY_DN27799_c0_g1_i1:104-562(-)
MSIERARKKLGWHPASVEAWMKETTAWWGKEDVLAEHFGAVQKQLPAAVRQYWEPIVQQLRAKQPKPAAPKAGRVKVKFANKLGSAAELLWVSKTGEEKLQKRLAAGEGTTVETHTGHKFVMRAGEQSKRFQVTAKVGQMQTFELKQQKSEL